MGLSSPQTPSYPGSSSVASNGTTLHRASRCRMASSRASTAACATSASMSTCSQTSPRRATSSKNGGTTTTPTDRTRASTGSHQPSSQLAPRRGKTGTDSPYDRGQIGEQVRWGEDGGNVPRLKRFLSEVKAGVVPQTLWTYEAVGHTQ